jgi:hypothetical protein
LKDDELAGIMEEPALHATQNSLFRIYPNPTAGTFTIESTGSENLSGHVEIYGMHGERVLSRQLYPGMKHEFTIADQPAGMYVVRIIGNGVSGTTRIVKR